MALLTPGDIRSKKIPLASRFNKGYDLDAVDDFLEECAQTVDELGKQQSKTQTRYTESDDDVVNSDLPPLFS